MSDKFRVRASSLNVRSGPSINDEVIGFLKKDSEIESLGKSGDGYWHRVKFEDGSGWISHRYLELRGDSADGTFPWTAIATAEVGVKEFPGSSDNPRIVQYLKSTSLGSPLNTNDETAWCSAFTNWCVERSGYEGTDSAWARSWQNWGKKTDVPVEGCIVVLTRPPNPAEGHVGFFMGESDGLIQILGGNQDDAVNIKSYDKNRLLSYRIPG